MNIRHVLKYIIYFLFSIGVSILAFIITEYSDGRQTIEECFSMDVQFYILNIFTCILILVFIDFCVGRLWLSGIIVLLLALLVGTVNFYVILYHGMPVSFKELHLLRTTLNVVGGYHFSITPEIKKMIHLCAIGLLICLCFRLYEYRKPDIWKWTILQRIIGAGMAVIVLMLAYYSPLAVKPEVTLWWSWRESYDIYGYIASTVESAYVALHPIEEPDGYSDEAIAKISMPKPKQGNAAPDIILILNESFYDLSQVLDIETDIPYLSEMDQLENAIRGYTVVPYIGGNTNFSEYELLTSNSTQLMQDICPFNQLDLSGRYSVVSVLKKQGYRCLAAHPAFGINYSRSVAYPQLGFDEIYFIDDFTDWETYGDRTQEKDCAAYRQLTSWYEKMPEDPRFLFLLTMQNHGGWDENNSTEDLVHIMGDYGELTETINEYLSCIYLSNLAFVELTEYYAQQERDVIICMVGDHSPSFIESVADPDVMQGEDALRLRSTPYIIWSNHLSIEGEERRIGLAALMPTLLETAGVSYPSYIKYILQMTDADPVISAAGIYYDNEGHCHDYATDMNDVVKDYFYSEYNNIMAGKDYKREWFEIK